MIRNYLKIAIRTLTKNKAYSFINIVGLSFSIACCLLIVMFIKHELSYDKFHSKADRIYRIAYTAQGFNLAAIPPPIGPLMKDNFAEVEQSARLFTRNVSVSISQENREPKRFEEDRVFFADSTLFEILSPEFVAGNPDVALRQPNGVVISEEVAKRYFDGVDALGKTIHLQANKPFEVIGVFKDFPDNSHIHFNMLLPYDAMFDIEPEGIGAAMRNNLSRNWMASHSYTYVLLKEGADPLNVNREFEGFLEEHTPENMRIGQLFSLQPMLDIHLGDPLLIEVETAGDMRFIYMFGGIATAILLIACFNFINLTTAHSMKRAREVGMRKVLGARRWQVFVQFLGESSLVILIAFALALGLGTLTLDKMNALTAKQFVPADLIDPNVIWVFSLVFLLAGIVGGAYPSFHLAQLSIIKTLRNKLDERRQLFSVRKALVVLQFAISITLITYAVIIFSQVNYVVSKSTGFKTDAIIGVPLLSQSFNNAFGGVDGRMRVRLNSFEELLASNPNVEGTTLSSILPGMGSVNRRIIPEGSNPEETMFAPVMAVDYDFLQVYDLQVLAGRNFDKGAGSDHLNAFIVNEEAVRSWEWGTPEAAIGKSIEVEGKQGTIIGITNDFHFANMRNEIGPLVLNIQVPLFTVFSVRLNAENASGTVAEIERVWQEHFPEKTFEYSYLSQDVRDLYQNDNQFAEMMQYFAILAILVSCLGAYGLVMFNAKHKEKEIGIRKVLGASTFRIVKIMFTEFTWIYLASLVLAIPLAYYFGNQWLDNFTYRIGISPLFFIGSAGLTLLILWITISYHSLKSAFSNPVDTLKNE